MHLESGPRLVFKAHSAKLRTFSDRGRRWPTTSNGLSYLANNHARRTQGDTKSPGNAIQHFKKKAGITVELQLRSQCPRYLPTVLDLTVLSTP